MSNVVHLAAFRRKTRKVFLGKHGARLDRFIQRFISAHIDVDFRQIQDDYQEVCARSGTSWDYMRFREVLMEALDEVFGKTLYEQLVREHWFDSKLITKDEIVERCLRAYVMGSDAAILFGK
jgi:hypothetical protein